MDQPVDSLGNCVLLVAKILLVRVIADSGALVDDCVVEQLQIRAGFELAKSHQGRSRSNTAPLQFVTLAQHLDTTAAENPIALRKPTQICSKFVEVLSYS